MPTTPCPQCGQPLPHGVEAWLCPRCLLGAAGSVAQTNPPLDSQRTDASPVLHYFGDYELLEEIARGGMGVVYRARQVSLNRTVAVKMLASGRFSGAASIARFRREAEAAANLQHSHIVAIHEVGEYEGQQFFSMDFVDGGHLGELVQNGSLPALRAAASVQTVAQAVHYAHERGVLHRDLKPSNILVDRSGQPYVTDFGLAKRFDPARPESPDSLNLTWTGQILGTPAFMSPEQARGSRDLTVATDLYSLGALLYFLITGRAPFLADSLESVLHQLLESEPIPPRLLNPSIPRDLETISLKCLSKETHHRYLSARELAEDLGRFLRDEPIQARPISGAEKTWRWCRRRPALAAALFACFGILMLGGSGIAWQWRRAEAQARRNSEIAEENRTRLVRVNVSNGLKLLDDGDSFGALPWFVEALDLDAGDPLREEPHRMRIASALAASPRIIHTWFHDDAIEHAEFSFDGRLVLTASRDGTARVWSTGTGRELLVLRPGSAVVDARFNSNATLIATAANETARVWDAVSGAPVTPWLRHEGSIRHLTFSPEGKRLITTSTDGTARLWNALTGELLVPPLKHGGAVSPCAFSPDGRSVATVSADQTARIWDAQTGQQRATIVAMTPNVYDVRFSADSRLVLAAGYAVARLCDAATGRPVIPALVHAQAVTSASFSPDEQRLLTSSDDRTVCIWDAATGQLTASPIRLLQSAKQASFSPDGQWLIHAGQDGVARIWNARDSTPASPPLRHGARLRRAWFSPDGRFVMTAGFDGMARLWAPSLGQPVRLFEHSSQVRVAAISKNGDRIVTGQTSGQVRVLDGDHGIELFRWELGPGDISDIEFSPDGQRVVIGNLKSGAAKVYDLQSGHELLNLPHSNGVVRTAFATAGDRIVTLSSLEARMAEDHRRVLTVRADVITHTWDARSGRPLNLPRRLPGTADPVALNPDATRVLTGLSGGGLRFWDTASGEATSPVLHPDQPGRFATFSPNSRFAAVADGDANSGRTVGTVEIWDSETGQRVGQPLHAKGGFVAASFSPDSKKIVTASADGTAWVWDVASSQPLTTPLVHRWDVLDSAFSADGRFVVTTSADTSARVWDALAGEPITPNLAHPGYVIRGMFDSRGTQVATWAGQSVRSSVRSEATLYLWQLPRDQRPVADLRQLAQLLAGVQVNSHGGSTPIEPATARRLWESVRAKFPDHFGNAPEEVRLAEAWEQGERWGRSQKFFQQAAATYPTNTSLATIAARMATSLTTAPPTQLQMPAEAVRIENTPWDSLRTVRSGVPARAMEAGPNQIDLTRYFNWGLTDSWPGASHECSLGQVPRGLVTLAGSQFDIRGVIQLRSRNKEDERFPNAIHGIRIERSIQRLHLLHSGRLRVRQGMTVLTVGINYTDLTRVEVPLHVGVDTWDWWFHPKITPRLLPITAPVPAWEGSNAEFAAGGAKLRLFKYTWENPRPGVPVKSFDLVSHQSDFAPFVLAITLE